MHTPALPLFQVLRNGSEIIGWPHLGQRLTPCLFLTTDELMWKAVSDFSGFQTTEQFHVSLILFGPESR